MREATILSVARAVRFSVMRLSRALRSEHSDPSLSLTERSVLASLARIGPMTPSALAEHERTKAPTMTHVLGELENRKYIQRIPWESDRRCVDIALTDEGVAFVHDDQRKPTEWLEAKIRKLSHEEQEILRIAAPILEKLSAP